MCQKEGCTRPHTESKVVICCLSLGNKYLLGMQVYTLSQQSRWGLDILTTTTLAPLHRKYRPVFGFSILISSCFNSPLFLESLYP